MIELMFPQTVSNILDYDGIKAAAKKYVEDVFVQITESFGNNLVLQSMDEEHLAEVAGHVTGNPETTLEELLDYINTDNIYHEFEFVNELTTAFPEGVEYKAFEVTGWQFPNADFPPFSEPDRSYNYNGTPRDGTEDEVWMENAFGEEGVQNLMMSRFRGQFNPVDGELTWHKTSGRRASLGNEETWMTTGGFGKPATIHINVDEARTVIEKNGLSSVENWLGTVSNKLPINLYIEINDQLWTHDSDDDVAGLAGSTEGYPMAFPYEEEEGFCTNDPDWPGPGPEPEPVLPTVSMNGDFGENNYLYCDDSGHNRTLDPDEIIYVYSLSGSAYWDDTKSYGVILWSTFRGSQGSGHWGFSLEKGSNNNYFYARNISSGILYLYVLRVAVCSSNLATVITVYDSSNNPYNAFKYTLNGTDYYYVLDGTQTDWTDDLASIGYKLPTIGYVSSIKTEISMNAGDLQTLYDENGTKMTVSTYGVSYPAVRVYSSSSDTTGTAVVNNNWTVHGPQFSSGDLSVSNLTGSTQTIQRIAFIK